MTTTLPVSRTPRPGASAGAGRPALPGLSAEAETLVARYADRENAALDLVLNRLADTSGRLDEAELESLVALLEGQQARRGGRDPSYAAEGRPDRTRFFTDVRRLWMHSAARQRPNAILLIAVRQAGADWNELSLDAQRRLQRAREALASVFGRLTPVYGFDRETLAMVLPGLNLRQAVAIAESTRRAVAAGHGKTGAGSLVIQAGVVALHREDDPSTAINLAVRCLELAGESPVSKVVCETDPEARFAFRSRVQDRPQHARAR